MKKHRGTILLLLVLCGIVALVVVGLWKIQGDNPLVVVIRHHPKGIMDTETNLTAVVDIDRRREGEVAVKDAEQALRDVEALMSRYIDRSEVSLFNAAAAGQVVPLSPDVIEVLLAGKKLHEKTDGAFDITIRPLIDLWKKAARENKLPDEDAILAAREESNWSQLDVFNDGAMKRVDTVSIDLGGIAKGYGIDQAVAAMQEDGCRGGLVDVGGDIRCFGLSPRGDAWQIDVRDPFGRDEPIAKLRLTDAAVCTSGNYQRFSKIGDKHYSHIIDPRTGWPVDIAPSVTVIAPTATEADGWATALSVLAHDGLRLIPPGSGIEAMLVIGTPEKYTIHKTPGFDRYVLK